MLCLRILLSFSLAVLYSQAGFSQPDIVLDSITSVNAPVDITGAGDGSNRLFIVNKAGLIRVYDQATSTLLPGNYLDISTQVLNSGEQGMLGLAFHPNYETNGHFYVNYVDVNTGNTHISRFTSLAPSGNTVNANTELILLDIPQPFSNHKGGDLSFGPDGYLYIGMGDGGSGGDPGNRAQNPLQLLGKMLRIDVNNTSPGKNYAIPPDNPFVGVQTPLDTLDEIWALGVRNPWRFSFDRATGDLWIADVGQNIWEEVDFQPAGSPGGENYGWRCYEGNHDFNPDGCAMITSYEGAIFEYDHNAVTGGNSITGGFVYRGTDVPSLQGWYVMADFTSDNFWLLKSDGTFDLQTTVPITSVVTFGEDDDGELYVSSYSGIGRIYKVLASPLPIDLLNFSGSYRQDRIQLTWTTATEQNAAYFQVERKTEGGDFHSIGRVTAKGDSWQKLDYFFDDPQAHAGANVYRLRMVDRDEKVRYSPAITIMVLEKSTWSLSPNPATNKVTLSFDGQAEPSSLNFKVYNAHGREVLAHEQMAPALPYQRDLQLTQLPTGVYFCRLEVDGKVQIRRLVIQ